MNVSLRPEIAKRVNQRVKSGKFASPEEVVTAAILALDPTALAVQITLNTTNGSYDWDNTSATYKRWPYSTIIQNNAVVPVQNTVSVTVSYAWVPELYLVGPINLQSTAVMPMNY